MTEAADFTLDVTGLLPFLLGNVHVSGLPGNRPNQVIHPYLLDLSLPPQLQQLHDEPDESHTL